MNDTRGRTATAPSAVPTAGWMDVGRRVKEGTKRDNVSLLAAGVAFYGLLALFPAALVAIALYGLFADPATIQSQVAEVTQALPEEVRNLISTQLQRISRGAGAGTGLALGFGVLVALWSASAGMKNLIAAVNAAYGEDEDRGFLKLRGLALTFTGGAIVFFLFTIGIIAVLPGVLGELGLGGAVRWVARWAPYLALAGLFMAGLSLIYRYGPARRPAQWRWVTWGSGLATLLWIAGSVGFSFYASNYGSYNQTYGSIGAVIVLMLWLVLTSFVVILGAEINAELERQTERDTTVGPERPVGARAAHAADTVGRHGGR